MSDPRKFTRFQAFVLEREYQLVYFEVPNNMMTGSQLRQESQEFERLFKLNKLAKEKGVEDGANNGAGSGKYQVYTSAMKN
jgi:hypothetical protein